eukprot:scaffold142013_cov31-Tisochrysis_lutea.AAC.11
MLYPRRCGSDELLAMWRFEKRGSKAPTHYSRPDDSPASAGKNARRRVIGPISQHPQAATASQPALRPLNLPWSSGTGTRYEFGGIRGQIIQPIQPLLAPYNNT